jgi:hypothetical protein
VNYGFGYGGVGYQGGYWNSGHFFYNRSVNNINVTVVHNVYNHTVIVNNNHVSFNGGPSGIRVRPRPAELAALREPHAAPMRAQVENAHAASTNRAQFASVNHGRPASAVIEKPLQADRDVHPVAAPPAHNQPAMRMEARPNAAQPAHGNEPARGAEPARNAPARNTPEKAAPAHPEAAPRATPHPPAAAHAPAAKPRAEERPAAPHAATPAKPKPAQHAAPAKAAPHEPAKPAAPKREDEHPQ